MNIQVGDEVCLKAPLPYLKTADPMPMLRPPDLVSPDEIGRVKGLRPLGLIEVVFRRGTFLIPEERLVLNS